MNARTDTAERLQLPATSFDFDDAFRTFYPRIARVIDRAVQDPARSEELAVEVFLKLWRTPQAHGESALGWLYRAAARKALDEIRHRTRRARYESATSVPAALPNPEELHHIRQEQQKVRTVLAAIERRHAEMLILLSHGLTYAELASALVLHPASISTFVSRARDAFRREYLARYQDVGGSET